DRPDRCVGAGVRHIPHVWLSNASLRRCRDPSTAELAGFAVGQLSDLSPAARAAGSLQPGGGEAASCAVRRPGAGPSRYLSPRSLAVCIQPLDRHAARDRRLVLHLRAAWNPAIFNAAPHYPPKGFHGKGFGPPAE